MGIIVKDALDYFFYILLYCVALFILCLKVEQKCGSSSQFGHN